jgi:hypothetical protein
VDNQTRHNVMKVQASALTIADTLCGEERLLAGSMPLRRIRGRGWPQALRGHAIKGVVVKVQG